MLESASFISINSTDSINKELANASMKKEWLESINKFIELTARTTEGCVWKRPLA